MSITAFRMGFLTVILVSALGLPLAATAQVEEARVQIDGMV